jgi:hypothetical protein
MKGVNMSLFEKVACVIDTRTNQRVSQFYSRSGDAKRKAKNMRHNGVFPYYDAVEFVLENPKVLPL